MKETIFKKGIKKRLFSVVLVLAMVITLLPMNSLTTHADTERILNLTLDFPSSVTLGTTPNRYFIDNQPVQNYSDNYASCGVRGTDRLVVMNYQCYGPDGVGIPAGKNSYPDKDGNLWAAMDGSYTEGKQYGRLVYLGDGANPTKFNINGVMYDAMKKDGSILIYAVYDLGTLDASGNFVGGAAPTTVAVTGVTLNKTSTTLAIDGTETLTATVAPADATNKAVAWTSDNTSVATVSDAGVVTAKSAGTATITVTTTDGSHTATCAVTVTGGDSGDGGSGDGGSTPTPDPAPSTPSDNTPAPSNSNYTVPVTGEDTVHVEAAIANNTATVSEITAGTLSQLGDAKNVSIDVSAANVKAAVVSKSTLATLTATVNDLSNNIDTVDVKLTNATLKLDKLALNGLLAQTEGTDLRLCVDNNEVTRLNASQQEALKNKNVAAVFDAYALSNGTRLHDFQGGTITVTVAFTPVSGTNPKNYHVEYIAPDGKVERYKTKYTENGLQFVIPHFSDYVIVYDTNSRSPKTGDDLTWLYAMMLLGVSMVGYGIFKKRATMR